MKVTNRIVSFFLQPAIKKIILLFVATRILLIFVGLATRVNYPDISRSYDVKDEAVYYGKLPTIFHGSDSGWYMSIASDGYPKIGIKNARFVQTPYPFFPLYPLLARLVGGVVGGNVWGGLFISNLSLLLSGIMLYLLVKIRHGGDIAFAAVKYLFIFPTSFIFSAILTESLFLFMLLLVFFFLEKKQFLYAGVAGFLLALTKYVGFLVFIPIAYYGFKFLWNGDWRSILKPILFSALPILGLLIFMHYLNRLSGEPLAIFTAQNAWGKSLDFGHNIVSFLGSIKYFWKYHFSSPLFLINIWLSFVLIVCALIGELKINFGYVFITISFCFAYLFTSGNLAHIVSFPRYFSILFPAYICLAKLSREIKYFDFPVSTVLYLLQLILFFDWTRGFPIPT